MIEIDSRLTSFIIFASRAKNNLRYLRYYTIKRNRAGDLFFFKNFKFLFETVIFERFENLIVRRLQARFQS